MKFGYHPQPKGRALVLDRIDVKAHRAKQERAFLAAVWKRDQNRCRGCGKRVTRGAPDMLKRGECHHVHGRNVRPEDRFNVAMAAILCRSCHSDPAVRARLRATVGEKS